MPTGACNRIRFRNGDVGSRVSKWSANARSQRAACIHFSTAVIARAKITCFLTRGLLRGYSTYDDQSGFYDLARYTFGDLPESPGVSGRYVYAV